MKHSIKYAVIFYVDMCACSYVHGGWKIASNLLTFLSVRTENNIEP